MEARFGVLYKVSQFLVTLCITISCVFVDRLGTESAKQQSRPQPLTSSVLKLVNSVLTLVSLGAVLIWLDAPLFLGLSLLVPCFIVNLKYFQPKIGKVAEATQHKTSDILGFFIERFDNIKLVQSYNTHRHESDKLGRRQGELFDLEMRSTALNLSAGSIASFIMSLAPVVILGWGGHQVMQGALGLGALIAFFQYFMRIFVPLENLNQLYIDCVRASVSLRRIVEFMDVPAEIECRVRSRPNPSRLRIK